MSYRTAILIDRYVKTFSDSENQPQRTTTVQYNSSLISGDDTMSEITTAAIGNYPTHSIPDVVSSPFSINAIGANGSPITTDLERQTNLQSTHRVTIGGVTYVRVPYRYGYVVNSNGKKYIEIVQPGNERFVWHSNLDEEAVEEFDLETYLENVYDWTRLDPVPEGLRGTFIYTNDTEDWTPDDEESLPENYYEGRVWPALKIFTDEDFKAVYESDDDHYYFLVENNGMDVLLGNLALVDNEYVHDGLNNQFLKGELLSEPIDAAIMNEGQEEIVSVDMKFGDEWYRVAGTDEVIHVIIPEQGETKSYVLKLEGYKTDLMKMVKEVSSHRGDNYSGLAEAKNYCDDNAVQFDETNSLYRVNYPKDLSQDELAEIREILDQLIANGTVSSFASYEITVKEESTEDEYMIKLHGEKLDVIKTVKHIASHRGDDAYSSLTDAKNYVEEHGTVDANVWTVTYPNNIEASERSGISDLIESLKTGDSPVITSPSSFEYEYILVGGEEPQADTWHIILGGGNVQLLKSVKEIATYLGDTEYSEISSAREYVEANVTSSGTCEYPRTITNQEKENLEAAISSGEVTIYGNYHFEPEGGIVVHDDGNEYEIHMSGAKLSIVKMVKYIAQTLGDENYDELGEVNTYVTDNSTVDESDVYHCVYPNTVTSVEKASLEYSIGDYMESSGSSTYSYEFVLVENSNPSGEATEYSINLSGVKLDVIKTIRNIATQRGDEDYDGLSEAKDYVDANGTVNSSTGICTATYPNTIQASERDGISALIDSLKTGDEPQIAESLTYTFVAV